MPAVVWWLLGFGIYVLGVISGLGLLRGAARSEQFEAGVRASWSTPSGPGAPRPPRI